MKKLVVVCLTITVQIIACGQERVRVSGHIENSESGEAIAGSTIYINNNVLGSTSNAYGFYSLILEKEKSNSICFTVVGYKKACYEFSINRDTVINVKIVPYSTKLESVVIKALSNKPVTIERNKFRMPVSTIENAPVVIGEKDVFKILQTLPGVQQVKEGFSSYFVRGSNSSQNLVLLDEAVVYNTTHLFGFLSIINTSSIKTIDFYKGGFPARYGGRLASVLDIKMREGNNKEFNFNGKLGLLSSNITLEGPIEKDKSSFLISGRRSYIDLFFPVFNSDDIKTKSAFGDLNLKLNRDFGKKNKLYLSGYLGSDNYSQKQELNGSTTSGGIDWSNKTLTLRWNHLLSNKLFSNASTIMSNFNFNSRQINESGGDRIEALYSSSISDKTLKLDFDYFASANAKIQFGLNLSHYEFKPSALTIRDTYIDSVNQQVTTWDTNEISSFIEGVFYLGKVQLDLGLRHQYFTLLNSNYSVFEPRSTIAYSPSSETEFYINYSKSNQFIHLLSNSGLGLPTDLWVPATAKVPPKSAHQFGVGSISHFSNNEYTLSVETYIKYLDNILTYKPGASFLIVDLNEIPERSKTLFWEESVYIGQGRAYGLEFLVQKNKGNIKGWIGYTISKSDNKFSEINSGKWFSSEQDRRHEVNINGSYKISDTKRLSFNWVFLSGAPVTIKKYNYMIRDHAFDDNTQINIVTQFTENNEFRGANTHRLDISFSTSKKRKITKEFGSFLYIMPITERIRFSTTLINVSKMVF